MNTADDAYRTASDRVETALNEVNRLVRAHGARQVRERLNWGDVTEVKDLVQRLNDVIEFLGGEKQ